MEATRRPTWMLSTARGGAAVEEINGAAEICSRERAGQFV